uniref:Zinc finger protein 346 n=2 Tax=Xenopus laevis TaxID=8355 RepID=ZN346_XENLA|nr:RecName: Full=Zinc finger protein 346; AltName: Full=Double-stranded RNA-binding protein ZFa; Short=DsRBP-ZFa; Short=ZFa; AltName: Full=Just another zinc finger protein; Short=Protein jaz [Xenopus laevis]AAH41713.1 Jaz protein [Xenopus laevis]
MADEFGNGDALDLPVGKDAVNSLIRENSHIFSDTQCKVCSAVLISESQKLAHYQSRKHANKVRRYMAINQGEDSVPAKKFKAAPAEISDGEDRSKCCPVCNMTFSSPVVAESHYIGKTHIKNLRLREQGGVKEGMVNQAKKTRTPTVATKSDNKMDHSDRAKFCKLCHSTFNNPLMAEQHYAGKKHKKQETKTQIMTIYTSSGQTPAQAPIPLNLNSPMPGSGSAGKGFSCDKCNIVLNSIEQYQAHVSGAKHKNQLMSMTPLSEEGHQAVVAPSAIASGSAGKGFSCDTCNIVLNSIEQYQAHISGAKHKNHLKSMTPLSEEGHTAAVAPSAFASGSAGKGFSCDTCNIVLNSIEQYQAHISGAKHKNHLMSMTPLSEEGHTAAVAPSAFASGSAGKGFSCDTCNIVLNSIEQYQAHVSGAKHKNQLMSMTPSSEEGLPSAVGPSAFASPLSAGGALSSGGPSGRGFCPSGDLTPKGPSSFGSLPPLGSLLPPLYPPAHSSQPYVHDDTMSPDGYNYFNEDFE